MNTVLTEEERALQMIYKEYADERIRPHTLEIDKGLFSVEPLLKEMHELGFCGIVIPKEYGGRGRSCRFCGWCRCARCGSRRSLGASSGSRCTGR